MFDVKIVSLTASQIGGYAGNIYLSSFTEANLSYHTTKKRIGRYDGNKPGGCEGPKSFLNMRKRLTVLLEYTLGIYIRLAANYKEQL